MTMGTTELRQWLRQNSAGIYRPAAEAADEIEALVAARDQHFRQAINNGAAAFEARAERDALRKDAERYRKLEAAAKEGLLSIKRASCEVLPDMRTHWVLPTLMASGPVGGTSAFGDAVDALP